MHSLSNTWLLVYLCFYCLLMFVLFIYVCIVYLCLYCFTYVYIVYLCLYCLLMFILFTIVYIALSITSIIYDINEQQDCATSSTWLLTYAYFHQQLLIKENFFSCCGCQIFHIFKYWLHILAAVNLLCRAALKKFTLIIIYLIS